ncbi:3-phosphoshikimate 1-carboxyvinyltransferase [Desulfohalovibrio reitneri]|uniref:3-phosphoshikimate 1-carboxyvinyltransferase n=1 Tax=Desulfohalovibrio reitneri TaxID=1307759 RepID=UPI0004A744CE|nr:3-phosphoshikimate 1-carboxyvinyltransferase [Desulfohalovibrio reitneri]
MTIHVNAPASKSCSHRACIAAALANGESRLTGVLRSDDLVATRRCLQAGGVGISEEEDGSLRVTGRPGGLVGGPSENEPVLLDVGESGTTARLMAGVAAAGQGTFEMRGAGRMHQRPMAGGAEPLHRLGCDFVWLENTGYPPFIIVTKGLSGGTVGVSLEESSQYLSGVLLAAPLASRGLVVIVTGKKVVSWPYVALTLQVLEDFGVDFEVQRKDDEGMWRAVPWREVERAEPRRTRFCMVPMSYAPRDYAVEGDWSNASYFLAAGAVGPAVTVSGLRRDSVQGDRAILDILRRMGAEAAWEGEDVTVSPGPDGLRGADLDMGHCPDLVPTVSALACFAKGPTTISNVAHLRIKESDRLEACAENIRRMGCGAEVLEDGLRVTPAAMPASGEVDLATFDDHRLAMSASLFELAGVGVRLDNPGCTAKSFPGFFEEWAKVRSGREP